MKQLILIVLATLSCGIASAQTPRISVTDGSVTINGKAVHYKATVQETFLPEKGDTVGSVITTSYEAEGTETQNRPVIFLFNGGPGASSSPLHLYAFGPIRLHKEADSTRQINNQYSLLDVADLVFIDPMGTGFTRVFKEPKAREYWDVEGDAKSVISIIKAWKEQHNRQASPIFICGESYGTVRAAEIMGIAEKFPVKGVLLFSPVLDFSIESPVSGNEMPYLLSLPTMAAVASFYHKAPGAPAAAQQAFNAGLDFAKNEYVRALFKGNTISAIEQNAVAEKLSGLTGLPVKTWLAHNLRITTDEFEMLLLAQENRRIGKLDARISAPKSPENKPYSARDDPSLVVNTVMRGDAAGKYFRGRLKFPDTSLYKGVDFTVNGKWKWTSMDAYLGYYSVLPGLEQAMKADPQLRLLVAGGIYDLATPLYTGKFLLEHSSIPADRTTFLAFPTGHSIFQDENELAKFSVNVKNFIAGK